MKRLLLVVSLLGALVACKKDVVYPSGPKHPDHLSGIDVPENVDQWIEKYLCEWYLWHEDIEGRPRDYSLGYTEFFTSLLSTDRNDGRVVETVDGMQRYFFSLIEREEAAPGRGASRATAGDNTLGFEFQIIGHWVMMPPNGEYPDGYNSFQPFFTVIYVVPGGPAEGKLKRGDHISVVNGRNIDADNYEELAYELLPIAYTGEQVQRARVQSYRLIATTDQIVAPGQPYNGEPVYERTPLSSEITIEPVVGVDTPILAHGVLTSGDFPNHGTKVGYLAYERFQTGDVAHEDFNFDDDLKSIIRDWKTDGVREAVIDLRYNGGGALSTCWMLSSMLVRADRIGTTVFSKDVRNAFVTREYFGGRDEVSLFRPVDFFVASESNEYSFGPERGANLNLERVYVLASDMSASASELLISSLRGAGVEVIHIGTTTIGKNVGMDRINGDHSNVAHPGTFRDPKDGRDYDYTMWPITLKCFNAKGETTPDTGWDPRKTGGHHIDEFSYPDLMCDLGDPDEPLLKAALTHIATGSFPALSRSAARSDRGGARAKFRQHLRNTNMYSIPKVIYPDERPARR